MATLTGKITDVTGRAPDSISSITVKAPSARIGSGTDVIVSSPAEVTFDETTGDITISGLTGGLSWLYIEGDGWSDSIALSVAEGMITLVEAIANAAGIPGIADYITLLTGLENRVDEIAQGAVDAAAGGIMWHRGDLPDGAVVDDMRLDEHKGGWALNATQTTQHSMPSDGYGMLFVQHVRGIAGYAYAIQVWESALRNDRWTRTRYRDGAWSDWLRSATSADIGSVTTTANSYADTAVSTATAGTKWIGYEQFANDLLRTDARGQLEISTASITGNGNVTNKKYVDDSVKIAKWLRGDLPDGAVIDDYRLAEHAGGWTLSAVQAESYNLPDAAYGLLHVLHVRGIAGYAYAIQAWESTLTGTRWTRTKQSDGPWAAWQAPWGGGSGTKPADPYEPVAVGMKNADLLDEFTARKGGTIGTGGRAAFALRLDHGTDAFRDELGPILKKYGLPATMAVYSEQNEVNAANHSVPWAEVQSWHHSHGMSYGNHSDDHLDKPDAEGWYGGTIASRQALTSLMPKVPIEQYIPHGSVGFERYGGFNKASSHELIVGTLAGRMALSTHALISGYRGGRYRNLTGRPIQGLTHWSMEESTPATFQSVIDTAISGGRGVAVMFHPEFIGLNGKMTWAQIDECLAYVAQKRDEGVLVPLTLDGLAVAEYRSDYRDDLLPEAVALMQDGGAIYGDFTETPGAFTSSTVGAYVRHLANVANTPELRGGTRTAQWHISSTAGGSARLSVTEALDTPTWGSERTVTFPAGQSVLYLPFGIPLDAGSMRIELTLLSGDVTIHETHAYAT